MLNANKGAEKSKKTHNSSVQITDSSTKEQGFSLVEILMSLLLMSLLVGVMFAIVTNSTSLNAKTELRADAGALAFAKVQDYVNLSYDNIPIGDDVDAYEVEDFSAEAEALNLANADAKVYVEPESEITTGTSTIVTNFTQAVSADSAFISGSEITAIDVDDATGAYPNSGNGDQDHISDNNYSNYTYNNNSPGADNKPLPSIDLGSEVTVDTIRIEWWSCNYGANDFRIEAKNSSPNNNSGWTTIAGGLSDNGISCSSTDSNSQDIDVSSNSTPYRHWRMYVVDGTHPWWNVISEFEAFSAGVPGDIVEQQGSSASDNPGELFFSSSDLEMSENGSSGQQSVGIIFDDIDAPQGSTVTNAYIEFTADETDSATVSLSVRGVDVDDAPQWVGSFAVDNAVDNDSSDGFVGTTESTVWNPGSWNPGEVSNDTRVGVTDIVQEIVNRAGWDTDNDMAFAVQYISGSGKRVAERNPSPRLVIEWSTTETTAAANAYVDNDSDGDVDNPTLVRVTSVISYDSFGTRQEVVYTTYIREFGVSD